MSHVENNPSKSTTQALSEIVGIISAGAGIFAILFYVAGRSFASGYFGAMNIPHYMVTFTVWEYGEVAWFPLFFYPIGMMLFAGLFWGVVYTIWDWTLTPLWEQLSRWLTEKIQVRMPKWQLPGIGKRSKRMFAIGLNTGAALILGMFVVLTLQFVHNFGASIGKSIVLENAQKVEIVSSNPLTLENPEVVLLQTGKNSGQYFSYSDYRLLTINDGKYYLFQEIDPVTCKPLKVYVLDAGVDKQINLYAPESLTGECLANTNPTANGNPTVIPTLAP